MLWIDTSINLFFMYLKQYKNKCYYYYLISVANWNLKNFGISKMHMGKQ